VNLTVSETLKWAFEVLSAAKVESPRADAEVIVGHYAGLARSDLYTEPRREVDEETAARIRDAVTRRTSGMPVQYVVGETEFLGARVKVRPGVLIPRPETELLAAEAARFLKAAISLKPPWGPLPPVAADLGTGSGAIAIALAKEVPELTVYATDASAVALEIAAENVALAGLGSRVVLLEGSMAEPLRAEGLEGRLAAVVSNPPYVSHGEWRSLPDHIRDYEPPEALLAGPDGLDFIERIVREAPEFLAPGGLLAFEMGAWHWPKVAALLDAQLELGGFRVLRDLAGYERIATAIRL